MDPLPNEEDYDNLPYTLPPGPYLTAKPCLSYAALVGQAIISSPQHRLTLQEIYDWITIVYPYFRRGETTWMNSIRHVLSTTACFRKVVRDRSVGRTLWAIWDEDLPCFEGGGFRKQLCRDMEGKTKLAPVKKRSAIEVEGPLKRVKRAKRDKQSLPQSDQVYMVPTTHPIPLFPHGPMFPPVRPTPQHQPYYESCLHQQIPAEIIFPPLPPSASYGYQQVLGTAAPANSTSSDEQPVASTSPKPNEPSCPSSMPDLTPNRSSSLSPPLPSDSGQVHEGEVAIHVSSDLATDTEPDGVFNVSAVEALEPGITLFDQGEKKKGVEERKTAKGKGKAKQDKVPFIFRFSNQVNSCFFLCTQLEIIRFAANTLFAYDESQVDIKGFQTREKLSATDHNTGLKYLHIRFETDKLQDAACRTSLYTSTPPAQPHDIQSTDIFSPHASLTQGPPHESFPEFSTLQVESRSSSTVGLLPQWRRGKVACRDGRRGGRVRERAHAVKETEYDDSGDIPAYYTQETYLPWYARFFFPLSYTRHPARRFALPHAWYFRPT
jgi:hypothetical protein